MNGSQLLAMQARRSPHHEAIVSNGKRVTYEEWDQTVNRLANGLASLGVGKGDKVILHMPNTEEFLYTYFATQRLDAIIVPINAKLVYDEILYIVEHSDAKAFFTHDLLFPQVAPLADSDLLCVKTGGADDGWRSLDALIKASPDTPRASTTTEDDEVALLYTSGTTGKPKGVLFTNRNIQTVATMMAIEMKMEPGSRVLHMMPLSHSAPLHLFMMSTTYVGGTHILAPTFTPELLLELVSKEHVTHFFGAPVAYLLTAKHKSVKEYDLSTMQYWVYGGAPLGTEEVKFVKEQFQTERLMCVYGLTEAGPNGTLLLPEEHDGKAGSIGRRPALNSEIDIVDENGDPVPPGQIGEIVLRGEGVMKGYYKDPIKTQEVLKDGWLYTGDVGKRDQDGFFWVIDRKKDLIISGGVNIFPKEIEEALLSHPSIADVAVVGIPHPDWGETVKAFVVPQNVEELLSEELSSFLKGKIADYKIPRVYEVLGSLPRNATGKLLKHQLRHSEMKEV
ncbi:MULTISPECIES: class I adenylate-forming enzyme family protein [Pontibacillus]|uniref:Long-chain-fatty-acid--CoA ligase n=1 Tax=Pontibacillus chungwhensis TaxID=265426 RepID=A0ABY8V3M9_9BACI|nr:MULTISPECIES: long-chain-fatty-acid--CoA ligase [Pontibacillus]MCD5322154.1 long-chain-fatty-acid--CoA ligase [Pontibacillus sp. HN14]WIF99449.1 long-chain-fatty-acid--CoA ligase [Pontibacillus chungwhensis]